MLITLVWVRADGVLCPPTDSDNHLLGAQTYARALRLGGAGGLWQTLRRSPENWPPASYLLYGGLAALAGDEPQTVRLCGLVLLPLLAWLAYALGRTLGGSGAGVLTALLVLFSFGVAGGVRQVSLDLPATLAVALAMLALLRGRLGEPRAVLAFGAACGLAVLTRAQAPFFLAAPALLVAAAALRRAGGWPARGRLLLWLGLGVLATAVVSSPWWAGRMHGILREGSAHVGGGGLAAGLAYFGACLGQLAGWPVTLTGLGLAPLLLARRRLEALLLLAWLLGAALAYSSTVAWEPRYLLPALPALVLLAVLGVRELRPRLRAVVVVLLVAGTVGPTLFVAAVPVRVRNRVVHDWLIEWCYIRPPARIGQFRARRAAAEVAAALGAGADESGGRGLYLYLGLDPRSSFTVETAVHLLPLLPALLASSSTIRAADSPWHLAERDRRRLFVLLEGERSLELAPVLDLPPGWLGNRRPVRLYRIPREHPLREDPRGLYSLTR